MIFLGVCQFMFSITHLHDMNRLPREFVRLVDYTYKYEREIPAYTSTACSLRGHITLA